MSALIDHLAAQGYEATHAHTDVAADYVEQVEVALGVLPPDYRAFLQACPRTGGLPGEAVLDLGGSVLGWSELYGLDRRPDWGLIPINRDVEEHRLDDMIVIGHDGSGNFLYMAIDDPHGPVFFRDRDGDDVPILVRESFEAFILASHGPDSPLTLG